MEIKQTLNIPASYFYQKVIDSVLFDIRKQTGQTMTAAQLMNYAYDKSFGNNGKATIKVTQLIKDQSYHYETSSPRGTYQASYDIFANNADSIQVIYRESAKASGKLQQANDAFMGVIMGFMRKRGFKKMLKQIEKSYTE
ncbi:DUF3284 domain-containing protein [Latilactobacillus fuchuensis]|jgi:hypothetical protein|uniref:DUF3284 domain-containing protein n=2 Tax=Latilactobacillus fuchuensis TaxID=164393 RepID=A0A2N9DX58_9LACO|nr:DUF3284 domain-containing protein [Latilactobacillus fuchuensis]KRL59312.1 hypothetical protein FC69_GL001751 [Latilactobacillus fuchuensis DSM 14340 = JCM 11249]MCP8856768.1 DUF3284 domain-containing protein [Latilactobacillus fuchuensis]SPC39262.1 conserved hypothetical protein [Latilactobacillus fuchuensis]